MGRSDLLNWDRRHCDTAPRQQLGRTLVGSAHKLTLPLRDV
jgi:hypothetical protein